MSIRFTVNGRAVETDLAPDTRLIDFLRETAHLTGTKEGCGAGDCGACTVLVDGRAVLSCLLLLAQMEGRACVTIEGLGRNGAPHPLQEAFVAHGAVQCGYCTPGMILSGVALLAENPRPDRAAIRVGLSGNLCRCTGYAKIVDAVEAASRAMAKGRGPREAKKDGGA